jgi:hypothetical protein
LQQQINAKPEPNQGYGGYLFGGCAGSDRHQQMKVSEPTMTKAGEELDFELAG